MIKIQHPRLSDICNSYADYVVHRPRKLKNNRYVQYLFIPDLLRQVVACPADKLSHIISEFQLRFPDVDIDSNEWKTFRTYMINQYHNIRNEFLFNVLKDLNLNVCPYCNRHYIFTINNGKRVSAQFDHFYSKTKYPYLALSFYNLIPCCPTCNKAKGELHIEINPYIKGFDNNCTIQIDSPLNCILQSGEWNVGIKGDKRSMTNVEAFVLNELYKKHNDYALEIVFKAIANEKGYLDTIKQDFMGMGLSEDLIQSILWNYETYTDNPQRPLSKMTNDIIKQIKELVLFIE